MKQNKLNGKMCRQPLIFFFLGALAFLIFTASAQAQTAQGAWDFLSKNNPNQPPAAQLFLNGDGTITFDFMLGTWTQSGNSVKGTVYGDKNFMRAGKPLATFNFEMSGDTLEGPFYNLVEKQNMHFYFRRTGASNQTVKEKAVTTNNQNTMKNSNSDTNKKAKASGESAQHCVDARTNGDTLTFTNNCGEAVFVLWCGDLKYSKKKCGGGSSGAYYTHSTNIAPSKESSTNINGQYKFAACKGQISFGNDGHYKDYSDGTYTCLKR